MGYSPCHLTTVLWQATGMPVTAWIIKRRIAAARHLLGEENLDVPTTCELVGFTDLCYFTRQFVRRDAGAFPRLIERRSPWRHTRVVGDGGLAAEPESSPSRYYR
jgi:AraC-like DNA-binding protein